MIYRAKILCSFRSVDKKINIYSLPIKQDLTKDLFSLYNYNNDNDIHINIGGDHILSITTISSYIKNREIIII